MKLLKLIPAAAIALTAFTTFEAKAGFPVPSGWTKKNACTNQKLGASNFGNQYYLLQKTDTPASYGVWNTHAPKWAVENVSYKSAKYVYLDKCDCSSDRQMNC